MRWFHRNDTQRLSKEAQQQRQGLTLQQQQETAVRRRETVYKNVVKVTISSLSESGREPSTVAVSKQRIFTGSVPIISSVLADLPCSALGVPGLLAQLNVILGTSYSLQNTPNLSHLLEHCISQNYDFGTAFARLRPRWFGDWNTILDEMRMDERNDTEMRAAAIGNGCIVHPYLPPRRVWDLYSNRVVPWWIVFARSRWESRYSLLGYIQGISHAWVTETDRVFATTTINGKEWPVPLPWDTDLNLVRIELLNLLVEYAWLDVLCLRQISPDPLKEEMRIDEWRLDVPTIGSVYQLHPNLNKDTQVICYLNGLGRPLDFDVDLTSNRSWFRRAWTVQELSASYVIGGITDTGNQEAVAKAQRQLSLVWEGVRPKTGGTNLRTFRVLAQMRGRISSNPVDQVGGLAFLLVSHVIPAYHAAQSADDAWAMLVATMDPLHRAIIFFLYPAPGYRDGTAQWWPSWDQVMSDSVALPSTDGILVHAYVHRDGDGGVDIVQCSCIESAYLQGLAQGESEIPRRGRLMITSQQGAQHSFEVAATHQWPIPDSFYALVGTPYYSEFWVVGQFMDGRFEKVSVVRLAVEGAREEIQKLYRGPDFTARLS